MQVSVLMAVYNNDTTLKVAVKSILNQSFKNFEFIIVDDASTDASLKILKSFKDKRIKLILNRKRLGLTKSLNKGLKHTKAEYVARMDADDVSLPTRLESQLAFLKKHSEVALLGTAVYLIDAQGKQIGLKRFPSDFQSLRSQVLHRCPFIHPTWMVRRRVLSEVGGYNPNFPFAQDYELILRLASKHQVANLSKPLLKYRVDSPEAISLKNLKQQEWLGLKARFLALTNYGYPITESWKLVKPFLSLLVPVFIKIPIYKKFYWQNR